ncbi:MAG: ABC transporter transmembrane domain-containing protein [Chloroflexia bacterium]
MMMRRTRLRGVAGAPVTRIGLRRLFGFVRPYRSRLALAALFTALGSLVFLALPWGVRYLIDAVVLRADLRLLNTVAVGLVVVLLVQSVFSYFSTYLVSYVGERVVADVRTQLFERLARLSLGYYNERKTGELMSRVANDATLIQTSVTNNVLNLLGQSVALIGGVAAMLLRTGG